MEKQGGLFKKVFVRAGFHTAFTGRFFWVAAGLRLGVFF